MCTFLMNAVGTNKGPNGLAAAGRKSRHAFGVASDRDFSKLAFWTQNSYDSAHRYNVISCQDHQPYNQSMNEIIVLVTEPSPRGTPEKRPMRDTSKPAN